MGKHNAIRDYAEKQKKTYREAVTDLLRENSLNVAAAARQIPVHRLSLRDFILRHDITVDGMTVVHTKKDGVR